jgi:hypothetical protein
LGQGFCLEFFSTVYSTVGQNFAAKVCNSLQRTANDGLQECLASAKLRNTANRAQFVSLELQIGCTVRLSYDAYVNYVILGDVLTFVLTPVVHRSPLECRLPMKNRQWRKGWDLSDVLPFGRLWYAEGDQECNRLRKVLGRNCERKKHAARA